MSRHTISELPAAPRPCLIEATPLEFELPDALSAHEPPEARGLPRDGVRLMVSRGAADIAHTEFRYLPDYLESGDLLVVNRSATLNAAFDAWLETAGSSESIVVHLSTVLSPDRWVVELRRRAAGGTVPLRSARAGQRVRLPAGVGARLIEPFASRPGGSFPPIRLWVAHVSGEARMPGYGDRYGRPIRYSYVPGEWPLASYQTMFATEPGSAEMPSAGRAFTPRVVRALGERGIEITGIVLHAGVSSLESDERPAPELFHVPADTAAAVNRTRDAGRRVIAVGTTVVRALESTVTPNGTVFQGKGWTDVVVTPDRPVLSADGLLTGLHAPRASHLLMLEAFAGRPAIARAYRAALDRRYLWHEFGDLHLLLRD